MLLSSKKISKNPFQKERGLHTNSNYKHKVERWSDGLHLTRNFLYASDGDRLKQKNLSDGGRQTG